MEENLQINIQAKVEKILGLEEVKQEISQSFSQPEDLSTGSHQENLRAFGGGFDEQQSQRDARSGAFQGSGKDEYGYEKFQADLSQRVNDTTDEFQKDLERINEEIAQDLKQAEDAGLGVSRQTRKKHLGWIDRAGNDFRNQMQEQFDTALELSGLDPEDPRVKESHENLQRVIAASRNELDGFKEAMGELAGGFAQAKEESNSFFNALLMFENLKNLISSAREIASFYIQEPVVESRIQAKYRTAFDYQTPIGMYSETEQAQMFDFSTRRQREAQKQGMFWKTGMLGLGGAIGTLGGAPGVMVGSLLGNTIGSIIDESFKAGAEEEIITAESKMQEELKLISQIMGIVQPRVQKFREYDRAVTLETARLGSRAGFRQAGDLGYTGVEEVQLETAFSGAIGRFSPELFREQTVFARAKGLAPEQVYSLNNFSRLTGERLDLGELAAGERMTGRLYGQDYDNIKIIEVLSAIRDINLQQLQLNIKSDSQAGHIMANIALKMFGEGSPYGRIDQLGGKTLEVLGGLFQPKNLPHEAFIYSMMGTPGLVEFEEMKRGGLFQLNAKGEPEVFNRMMTGLRGMGEMMTPAQMALMLQGMTGVVPQGMIPQLTELFTTGGMNVERRRGRMTDGIFSEDKEGDTVEIIRDGKITYERATEENKKYRVTIQELTTNTGELNTAFRNLRESYETEAQKNISATEKLMTAIDEVQRGIGAKWTGLMAKMEIESEKFMKILSESPKIYEKIESTIDLGLIRMAKSFVDKNIISQDKAVELLKELDVDDDLIKEIIKSGMKVPVHDSRGRNTERIYIQGRDTKDKSDDYWYNSTDPTIIYYNSGDELFPDVKTMSPEKLNPKQKESYEKSRRGSWNVEPAGSTVSDNSVLIQLLSQISDKLDGIYPNISIFSDDPGRVFRIQNQVVG